MCRDLIIHLRINGFENVFDKYLGYLFHYMVTILHDHYTLFSIRISLLVIQV